MTIDARHVCLGCGAPMSEIGCKLRCPRCGYFEDCGNGLTPPPLDGGVGAPLLHRWPADRLQ